MTHTHTRHGLARETGRQAVKQAGRQPSIDQTDVLSLECRCVLLCLSWLLSWLLLSPSVLLPTTQPWQGVGLKPHAAGSGQPAIHIPAMHASHFTAVHQLG